MFVLTSLAAMLVASQGVLAVDGPFGFASGTTGGGFAAEAVPTSTTQLKIWLEDNTARTILLNRTYDFTDTEAWLDYGDWLQALDLLPQPPAGDQRQ
ncbi:hypothetical protein RSAG8_11867, partial [Rhizoctonia solani AG-8 WAC10335]